MGRVITADGTTTYDPPIRDLTGICPGFLEKHPDLAEVATRWPDLSEADRAAVLDVVRTASGTVEERRNTDA